MLDLCRLIFAIASGLLRSRVALEAKILVLRQQINALRRARRFHVPPRQRDAFCPVRSWADCITNMLGLDLR
jgi:hypothetical protein